MVRWGFLKKDVSFLPHSFIGTTPLRCFRNNVAMKKRKDGTLLSYLGLTMSTEQSFIFTVKTWWSVWL